MEDNRQSTRGSFRDQAAGSRGRRKRPGSSTGPPARRPGEIGGMERVIGLRRVLMRAADPAALGAWYRDCLGLDAD